ncbi:MAG TPA: hypothetical protein VK791_05945, partial [bacterium]|nr:hypothetical protein [bacterium]
MANKNQKLTLDFRQLTFFNILLFVFLLGVMEYFFLSAGVMLFDNFTHAAELGEAVLAGFVILLILEMGLIFKLDNNKSKDHFLTPLLLTHLPWVLGLGLSFVVRYNLPDPHNFLLRKIEILFGFV